MWWSYDHDIPAKHICKLKKVAVKCIPTAAPAESNDSRATNTELNSHQNYHWKWNKSRYIKQPQGTLMSLSK